jgi:hypothetical protein
MDNGNSFQKLLVLIITGKMNCVLTGIPLLMAGFYFKSTNLMEYAIYLLCRKHAAFGEIAVQIVLAFEKPLLLLQLYLVLI